MNERELRVLRALAENLRAIREEIHAIHEDQRTHTDTNNNEPVQPLRVEVTAAPQLDPARREYYEAENRDRDSLWSRIKPWLESTGVLIGLALMVLTWRTLMQVQRQADIAETETRPWLKIVDVKLDTSPNSLPVLHFQSLGSGPRIDGTNLRVEFRIKNIGKGVAQDVFIMPNLIFTLWNDPTTNKMETDQKLVCNQASTFNPGTPFTWSALFPDDERLFRVAVFGRYGEDTISHIPERTGNWLSGILYGCVAYQRPRRYQTSAAFHVMGPTDRFVEVGKDLTETQIHLLRDEHYEYAQ
jgi:hypothetical protein